jgi:hypothetical protein
MSAASRSLTSPCSRRAAARRDPRRGHPGPRPAAEGQLVRQPKKLALDAVLGLVIFALASAGCSSARPAVPPDLSGSYLFTWSGYEGDVPMRGIPLLPLRDLQDNSVVKISIESSRELLITFTDSSGLPSVYSTSLDNESLTWSKTAFLATIKPTGGVPILPGLARERVRSELSRDCNGRLIFEWSYREYGLMLFLVPFIDAYSGRAILEPAPPIANCRTPCNWGVHLWVA